MKTRKPRRKDRRYIWTLTKRMYVVKTIIMKAIIQRIANYAKMMNTILNNVYKGYIGDDVHTRKLWLNYVAQTKIIVVPTKKKLVIMCNPTTKENKVIGNITNLPRLWRFI
jgi:hypothetical protein